VGVPRLAGDKGQLGCEQVWAGRRVALGLTAAAALALVCGAIAALLMPTDWCSEMGTPTSEAIMLGSLVVAAVALLFALLVALASGELRILGLACVLIIGGGAGVVMLAADRYSSWLCG